MGEFELVCAVAFLFSLLMCLASERESRSPAGLLRPFLLGNVALSTLIWWGNAGISLRHALLLLALGMGATEAGYWAARGLSAVLPQRIAPPAAPIGPPEPWGWKNDRWGCGVTLIVGLAMLIVLNLARGEPD